jgi:hypothetical protein
MQKLLRRRSYDDHKPQEPNGQAGANLASDENENRGQKTCHNSPWADIFRQMPPDEMVAPLAKLNR